MQRYSEKHTSEMGNGLNHHRVGLLIPTYNRREYLKCALKSALDQTHADLEIIVIDNGSTDGTADFMASISDKRIRHVVNERNIGMIGSINKGIRLFTEQVEWCTILCDDDMFGADFIRTLLHTVALQSAKTIIHAHKVLIDAHENKIRDALLPPPEETALHYLINRTRYKRETFLSGIFFTRTAFNEIGGYPRFTTGLASDDAFIFALSLKDRLIFERNATVFIRMHGDAESHQHANIVHSFHSMNEFGAYCDRAAKKDGRLNSDQIKELSAAVKRYIKLKNSALLMKRLLDLTHSPSDVFHENLLEISRISKENIFPFVRSVKLIVFCAYLSNLLPVSLNARKFLQKALKTILFYWRTVLRH